METIIAIIAGMFFVIMIVILVMLAKLLFGDSNPSESGTTIYMLEVGKNGNVRIKRHHGQMKYWNDMKR